jgi:hypothetical protein
MSAPLSRRYARVTGFPPIVDAPIEVWADPDHLTVARRMEFGDLPVRS